MYFAELRESACTYVAGVRVSFLVGDSKQRQHSTRRDGRGWANLFLADDFFDFPFRPPEHRSGIAETSRQSRRSDTDTLSGARLLGDPSSATRCLQTHLPSASRPTCVVFARLKTCKVRPARYSNLCAAAPFARALVSKYLSYRHRSGVGLPFCATPRPFRAFCVPRGRQVGQRFAVWIS